MLIRSSQPKCMLQREESSFSTPAFLFCRVILRSPFLYFNVMIPSLILIKPKD
jgi:hypothetical protein